MKKLFVIFAFLFSVGVTAQTVTTIQPLGTIAAQQAANGLGFNIDPASAFEFQAAQAVGSTWVRFDCGWTSVEIQNTNNTSGGYTWPTSCAAGTTSSLAYGQHPLIDALFGPPYQQIASLRVSASTATGAYVVPVVSTSGDSLSQLASACFDTQSKPQCEVIETGNTQITGRWDYSGSIITAINSSAGTITIGSATTVALTTSSSLVVNQLLYSPILLTYNAATLLTDASTAAYVHYAAYIAKQIQQAGLTGQVGLWNEPEWLGGYWISGTDLYDTPPIVGADVLGEQAVIAIAANNAPVSGVTYTSNWTNLTGYASIYSNPAQVRSYTTIPHAQQVVTGEAIHPYGNNPEDDMWSSSCVRAQSLLGSPNNAEAQCALVGGVPGSNFKDVAIYSMQPANMGGATQNITETGIDLQQINVTARFELRQFLGFEAIGVTPVMFYKMSCSGDNFDFIGCSAPHTPNQQYTDFAALMTDIGSMALMPQHPWSACNTPQVVSFTGYYPLDTATLVGSRNTSDQDNSELFFAWQASYTTGSWPTLASPAAVPVTVNIPATMQVSKVVDTVTLNAVAYSVGGSNVTYPVADNPIEMMLIPRNNGSAQTSCTAP